MSTAVSTCFIFISLSVSVAGYSLLVHHSRKTSGPKYATSTVVLLTEVLKLLSGLLMLLHEQRWNCSRLWGALHEGIWQNPREFAKTSLPSLIYALQNNLVMISLSNLDAATFQVTSQLKIFSTALFMWLLLGKRFCRRRCFALLILCCGELLVHWDMPVPESTRTVPSHSSVGGRFANGVCTTEVDSAAARNVIYDELSETHEVRDNCSDVVALSPDSHGGSYILGVSAALVTCIGSGFAGVYLEMILKASSCPFWIRNIQLYLSGVLINGFIMILSHWYEPSPEGLFHGFNGLTFLIIISAATIGFCTAFIIKRLDNIWKNLASSISVLMATLGSSLFFGTQVGIVTLVGTLLVILVPWLYQSGDTNRKVSKD